MPSDSYSVYVTIDNDMLETMKANANQGLTTHRNHIYPRKTSKNITEKRYQVLYTFTYVRVCSRLLTHEHMVIGPPLRSAAGMMKVI